LAIFRSPGARQIAVPLSVIPAVIVCASLRFEGVTGEVNAQVRPRWAPKAEDLYVASRGGPKSAVLRDAAVAKPLQLTAADWPGVRGPPRDGVLPGVRVSHHC